MENEKLLAPSTVGEMHETDIHTAVIHNRRFIASLECKWLRFNKNEMY